MRSWDAARRPVEESRAARGKVTDYTPNWVAVTLPGRGGGVDQSESAEPIKAKDAMKI
jgi:hypothetical protein